MRNKLIPLFVLALRFPLVASAPDPEPVVSIYDEFDDGLFGKSRDRGVIVSVKKAAFARAETLEVAEDGGSGFLTAVIMSRETAEKLLSGKYNLPSKEIGPHRVFTYRSEGLDISFSVEMPGQSMIRMVSDFYSGDERWHDLLVEHYRENYVIRIHRAENVFDSWNDEITYNEAMVAATLLGDSDQWLWGIHNGEDILNKGY
ncbi:MAG: hypothetical protein JXR86_08090 [Spirochaetales bacterium]|nr:hypothetical protein [Spirochaetales bacterium]